MSTIAVFERDRECTPSDYTVVTATGTLVVRGEPDDRHGGRDGARRRLLEHNETLFLTLTNPSSGGDRHGQGTGTIVNDDTKTTVVVKVRAAKHPVAVRGRVTPSRPGKQAVVRLYRKGSGGWVRVATRANAAARQDGHERRRLHRQPLQVNPQAGQARTVPDRRHIPRGHEIRGQQDGEALPLLTTRPAPPAPWTMDGARRCPGVSLDPAWFACDAHCPCSKRSPSSLRSWRSG